MWRWAGGESRESVHCYDCTTKRRPLKWYEFWVAWLCPKCMEKRVAVTVSVLN